MSTVQECVVLVDDDPLFRRALKRRLERDGWEVCTCVTISDAVRALARLTPTAVVADLNLPDGFGMELVERALAHVGRDQVIAISGDAAHARDRAAQLGVALVDKSQLDVLLERLATLRACRARAG